jgi:hypothetical protein
VIPLADPRFPLVSVFFSSSGRHGLPAVRSCQSFTARVAAALPALLSRFDLVLISSAFSSLFSCPGYDQRPGYDEWRRLYPLCGRHVRR